MGGSQKQKEHLKSEKQFTISSGNNMIMNLLSEIVEAQNQWVLAIQSCPTLCDPMDCSLPGSSVHGILQMRILEWVAIPFSRGFSWFRDWTSASCVSCTEGRFFPIWATREAPKINEMTC